MTWTCFICGGDGPRHKNSEICGPCNTRLAGEGSRFCNRGLHIAPVASFGSNGCKACAAAKMRTWRAGEKVRTWRGMVSRG